MSQRKRDPTCFWPTPGRSARISTPLFRKVNAVTHSFLGNPKFAAKVAREYDMNRTGIFTNVVRDLFAFEKLPGGAVTDSIRAAIDYTFGADWTDVEIFSLDGYTGSLNGFLFDTPDLKNYTFACVALIAPFSRGYVTNSSIQHDTSVHPVVDPNWLTDPRDQEVAVARWKEMTNETTSISTV